MRPGRNNPAAFWAAFGVSLALLAPCAAAGEASAANASVPGGATEVIEAADVGFADAAAAMDFLEGVNWNGGSVDQSKLDAAAAVLAPAAEREPKNARWQTGLAIIGVTKRDLKAAKAHAEKAVALDPKSADAQYWLGNAMFNDINNVGMLDKMSYASKGRKAYEKAIEANPKHIGARVGLIQFYLNAPGIAGGSVKKAKELATQLTALPGGEVIGHLTLAQAATKDGEHDVARSEFDAAYAAAADDAQRRDVLLGQASALLREKKDPGAALAVAERALALAGNRESQARYLIGDCKRQMKDYAGAVEQFTLVLAKQPEALNTRYALAQSYEAQAQWADAAREYEEFARRFPNDDRAGDATKAAKKAKKQAGATGRS